jgi:transposase InsO family protein
LSTNEPSRFSREFKLEALRWMEAGENVGVLARELGVSRKSIYQWRNRYRLGGGNALRSHRGRRNIRTSMSRVGNPYDNAKSESFMKTLKQEEINGGSYRNLSQARSAIGAFIETVYNP